MLPGCAGRLTMIFEQKNLPSQWQTIKLSTLIEEGVLWAQSGFAQGGFNEDGDGVPHIRPFNVTEDGEISLEQIKYVPPPPEDGSFWLQPGDVIFNNTNSEDLVGKTAYFNLGGQFVYSNHMTALRVLEPDIVDAYWLARYLHYLWQSGKFKMLCRRYVGQASVSLQKLKTVDLWLPPLAEQQAITAVLRTTQDAISARQQEAALERERKAALMQHLFTYGTRGEELKETEYGRVPRSWQQKELREVADIAYGIQAAVAHLLDESKGIPILTNVNITNEGNLDLTTLRYYEVSPVKREQLILRKGDVLLNWRSGSSKHVGKTAFFNLDGEYTFSSFILRFRVKDEVNNLYLAKYLHYLKAIGFFEQNRQQSTINSTFNASIAAGTPILFPDRDEQIRIVDVLSACDNKIAALEKEITTLNELFQVLLEELMSGQILIGSAIRA